MAATRPLIFSTLKSLLQGGVPAVSQRVYLPWDDMPDVDNMPVLQIAIDNTDVELVGISHSRHTVQISVAALRPGKFDYQATWNMLSSVSAVFATNYTLSGKAEVVTITGAADHVTVAGDKILWPHLTATIIYRTPLGEL